MARSLLRRCGHLGFCHYERSEVIQKQVLLAMGLPRRVFYTSRNDKIRMASHGQIQGCHREHSVNCHGEESFKTTRPSCFCHYERSEVIHKQVLLAMGLPRRVFYTSRNDKIRMASFLAMTRNS